MRLYTFSNMYLSPLQVGLQGAHVLSEMVVKYDTPIEEPYCEYKRSEMYQWMRNHKTIIMLNGGYSSALEDLVTTFSSDQNEFFPWAKFNESHDALNGALTCVGIVLPEMIYEGAAVLRNESTKVVLNNLLDTGTLTIKNMTVPFTPWGVDMMLQLNTFGLAR